MPRTIPAKECHPGVQGGERTVATEEDLKNITEWAASGLTLRSIARKLGISSSLLDTWMGSNTAKSHLANPAVRAAWEEGIAMLEEDMDSVMMKVALDPTHRAFPNMSIWAQKVKLGRSEKRITEHEISDETKTRVGSLFSPGIQIGVTHRDPKTGETLQEPTIIDVTEGE